MGATCRMSESSYPPPYDLASAISGVEWPAVPEANASVLFALLFQLEQTQWWSPEQLRAHQWKQLRRELEHAYRTVPFYHERLDSAGLKVAASPSACCWFSHTSGAAGSFGLPVFGSKSRDEMIRLPLCSVSVA